MSRRSTHEARASRSRSSGRTALGDVLSHESANLSIVGIGASAGGLDACTKLMDAMPAGIGMAFVLVQHLDPTHDSMLVELLAGHTSMTLQQAADGMVIEPDHLYVIPPGTYLSVGMGVLHLSAPQARHGARLPFDFLLHSLAEQYGPRAICIILSGTGADGSLGLRAVKEKGGLVVVQDPDEAGYDGMPRSAVMTGAVDLVLPVARIPGALVKYDRRMTLVRAQNSARPENAPQEWLAEIIDLLRTKTAHDFTLYKQGTLERRIERRMAMATAEGDGMDRYLEILRNDPVELDVLAKNLLINVTSFFRDTKVFDFLETKVIPDLVRNQTGDNPLRIWIAGCSTGEETYSLAMLFREQIDASKRNVKLQVFASDVDPDAVTHAREGLYSKTIEGDISPERLARFFSKEDHGYRISPELRAVVVFTVQDVLSDPPFSRIDLVSCRNLLIYLEPEAQKKVISVFHFALREDGVLLLGSSETIGNVDSHFEVISKSDRVYRHIGRSRPGDAGFAMRSSDGVRVPMRVSQGQVPSRQAALADLCRRLVMETYAPAAILINRKHECLYFLGPTDRYLQVAQGHPTHDLLAMANPGLRTKLRSVIQQAYQVNSRVVVAGERTGPTGTMLSFDIAAQPVRNDGEDLLLICFLDALKLEQKPGRVTKSRDGPQVVELEHELRATRTELQGAIHSLEISNQEQKAINEEALSVNEEFQSTNEELLTSKEELQSLNEELTALNSQLQETLERQRTTSNDLQNILYSTDVATLFLDTSLNIRFFTPATKAIFNVMPGDVGRPLADLNSLAPDSSLLADARSVLQSPAAFEHEIQARSGAWYLRRMLPYRTQGGGIDGVVITFIDITDRKHVADALGVAERRAQTATLAKSRFLAAASHDLRQPLQTLTLLHGLLAKSAMGEKAQKLVARLDETLSAMSGMLNTLLDINRIEAGTVRPEMSTFPISEIFDRLKDEFTYHAHAQRLILHVVSCSQLVYSDPGLLEQMIRNVLSNALKYTKKGKVLLGCRRRNGTLSIEISDTGVGIPEGELQAIFEEYHQIDNAARERSRGLGLGLSIVRSLGKVLGHAVRVRSRVGKGSTFSIEVDLPVGRAIPHHQPIPKRVDDESALATHSSGTIMVVEDDPEVRELLTLHLRNDGYHVLAALDGVTAMALVAGEGVRPDLVLADYNLPNGMNGLQLSANLREKLAFQIPVIILTGDISTDTLRGIALQNCVQLNKPTKLKELAQAIQRLMPVTQSATPPRETPSKTTGADPGASVIFVVDDDRHVREAIRAVLEDAGRIVEDFETCEAFLEVYKPGREACLLVDAYLPGMSGLELLRQLTAAGHRLPAIMITGNSDVPMAVQAMKAGASDFIEKPISRDDLLAGVARALEQSRDSSKLIAWQEAAASHVAGLTPRQRQIMEMVLAGHPSKNIAVDLGISQRTVENHRAMIMKKTGSKSLPALARLALTATPNVVGEKPAFK